MILEIKGKIQDAVLAFGTYDVITWDREKKSLIMRSVLKSCSDRPTAALGHAPPVVCMIYDRAQRLPNLQNEP